MGTGTGILCINVADMHPEADMKGIDISLVQPTFVPPNCRFEINEYNLECLDDDKFNLIHQRELLGAVPDWSEFYQECFNALAPGGWIDIMETDVKMYYSAAKDGQAFDDFTSKDHPLK